MYTPLSVRTRQTNTYETLSVNTQTHTHTHTLAYLQTFPITLYTFLLSRTISRTLSFMGPKIALCGGGGEGGKEGEEGRRGGGEVRRKGVGSV